MLEALSQEYKTIGIEIESGAREAARTKESVSVVI